MYARNELGRARPSLKDEVGRIGERLKIAIGQHSQRGVSDAAGLSSGTVYSILNGGVPNLLNAAFLADVLGVRLEWLATGAGPMRSSDSAKEPSAIDQIGEQQPHPDEYAYIPLYNVEASAGYGSYVDSEEISSRLAFRRDWLHQEVHANPANLHLIYVRGDSMQPALESGQVVMVDTSAAHDAIRDGIHVIQIDGSVLIKRLQRLPGNKIMVMSDNKIYPSFEADLNADQITIIGRVIWHAGRI